MIALAVQSYESALGLATGPAARASLKVKVGNAYVPIGDPRGLAYLEEALVELDPKTQTNALALATALMGRYYHYRTEHRKAIEFLERARQLAEPLGDAETISNIYMYLAGAHQHLLQYDDSNRWARASIELGERERFPFAVALGNEFLGENAAGRGHWDDALAYSARNAEEGRKIGSLTRITWAEFSRAQGLHGKGELRAGLQGTLTALAMCEQIGETRLATWLDPMAAIIAVDLGDDESARMRAQRGLERAQQLNQLVLSAWALHAQGYIAIKRGDMRTALEWYEQYVALVRDTENGVARHLVMARAAEAYFLSGCLDDATRLSERAIADATFANAPHYLALARRVQGQILGARKRYDDAMSAFDEAIAAFIATGSRLELARAMYHRAALRFELGDRDAARADAARARDEFAAMEAVRDRAMAEALLGK